MRWSSLAVAALVTGCVHTPAQPDSVSASVEPSANACDLIAKSRSVLLTVRNSGPGKLRISAQDEAGPPFRMGWPYYTVLSGETDPPTVYKNPMGHGNLPIATVSLDPGDETQFLLYLGEFTPVSERLRYRAQFEDQSGQVYFSSPFSLCSPGSMPSDSCMDCPVN